MSWLRVLGDNASLQRLNVNCSKDYREIVIEKTGNIENRETE